MTSGCRLLHMNCGVFRTSEDFCRVISRSSKCFQKVGSSRQCSCLFVCSNVLERQAPWRGFVVSGVELFGCLWWRLLWCHNSWALILATKPNTQQIRFHMVITLSYCWATVVVVYGLLLIVCSSIVVSIRHSRWTFEPFFGRRDEILLTGRGGFVA